MTSTTRSSQAALMASVGSLAWMASCSNTASRGGDFGRVGTAPAQLFTLENSRGMKVKISNYGAVVTEVHVPDRNGRFADVVLGHDHVDGYVHRSPYFGAMVGRVANRIAGGLFTLDGAPYRLATNNGRHHLHGGLRGFDKALWRTDGVREGAQGPTLRLHYVSSDGEEGYPGTVAASVLYSVTHDNALRVEMTATTDKPTLVNLAHHGYWNLAGHDRGDILQHELRLSADAYTPSTPELVPVGVIQPVDGTAFDFTQSKAVGRDLEQLTRANGARAAGYDHNFVVRGDPHALRHVATLTDRESGRRMELRANMPGVQFYSGNFLDGVVGKGGTRYEVHGGLCLETQYFPNAINVHDDRWEDPVLRPGETYRHVMVHAFSTDSVDSADSVDG